MLGLYHSFILLRVVQEIGLLYKGFITYHYRIQVVNQSVIESLNDLVSDSKCEWTSSLLGCSNWILNSLAGDFSDSNTLAALK